MSAKVKHHEDSVHERTLSDPEIARAVRLALKQAKVTVPDTVRVKVSEGWITLSGEVDNPRRREHLVAAIGKVPGARGVSNLILIRSHEPPIEPETVRQAIERALTLQADREARRIEVAIDQDTVVLTGNVRSWTERCAAVGAAGDAPGVRAVTDRLHIKTPV
ncbi:MAG TPA: BON domain-containing protein [Chloroflexota bacterium]|nr:BON domain-containing protein [Chloroflexota bacterium]